MFGVLPKVFESFPLGGAVGALFFLLVFFCGPYLVHFPAGDGGIDPYG